MSHICSKTDSSIDSSASFSWLSVIVDLDCIAHFQPRGNSCHFVHDTRVERKKQNVATFVGNLTKKGATIVIPGPSSSSPLIESSLSPCLRIIFVRDRSQNPPTIAGIDYEFTMNLFALRVLPERIENLLFTDCDYRWPYRSLILFFL